MKFGAYSIWISLFWVGPLVCTSVQSQEQPIDQQKEAPGAYFRHKTVLIPHDDKRDRGGEDAAATSDTLLVIADGVGGWARHGVNPGLYSRKLTETILELHTNNLKNQSLGEIVHEANWKAASEHLGSATCTALHILDKDTIGTLNVGDSGYALFRMVPPKDETLDSERPSLKLMFESVPAQKGFNYPYQLGGKHGDQVSKVAARKKHPIQNGDIIVVYSDGVSDNLHAKDFDTCLLSYMNSDAAITGDWHELFGSYSLAADCIARQAYFLGKDPTLDSPFAQGARLVGKRYSGGKHDDISVTVAQVFVGDPSDAETMAVVENDPHYAESIRIYTGPVQRVDQLPKLPKKKAGLHQEL